MSKELTRYASNALVKGDGEVSHTVGKSLLLVGGGGLIAILMAGLLPFVSLPFLLVMFVIAGVVLV